MPTVAPKILTDLRSRIARIIRDPARRRAPVLRFGIPALDRHLPDGGLAIGALHEAAGTGPDTEHAAAAALFAAGALARLRGPVLWALPHDDLFVPALAGVGLHPDRLILAEAGRQVLSVMEEGLRHHGLAGVVGELDGRLTLTASRRLQLAAEASGVTAIVLRRTRRRNLSRMHPQDLLRMHAQDDPALADPTLGDPTLAEPNAAVTRWRLTALPSAPPLPRAPPFLHASDVPGLERARWRLELLRCRGGNPATWIVEACDATGHLALVAELPDRSAAPLPASGTLNRHTAHRRAAG
jgi:protein ImuA